ncbi:HNH endonuclease [Sphingosinicella sp.]|uniref:HNH endonuclease n=1 Tax=Sphingosinicella sp. TaxID=1917971 RepID=UPI0026065478|nr:HNH endonuclease [Sphingosinicella sp.]
MLAKTLNNKAKLREARETVRIGCDRYKRKAPDFLSLRQVELSDEEKAALRHAFDVATRPMAELRGFLLSGSLQQCPFCGLTGASSLDHYLPKDAYPEYSIFSKNLVPACPDCNNLKRDIVRNDKGARAFLHPYFDLVPTVAFLTLAVRLRARAIELRFSVVQEDGIDAEAFGRIESHFKILDLADRYRVKALLELRGIKGALRDHHREGGAEKVSAELLRVGRSWEESFGVNYWRGLLYRTLAAQADFCDRGFDVVVR